MRIVFLGSGPFGLPTVRRLSSEHEVLAVVTQPDRPAGRSRRSTPTEIARWAADQGLTTLKVPNVNDAATVGRMSELRPDAAIVIAFGQKLGPALVDHLGFSANLHASLLPAYRGAAPINRALMHGERRTGVTVIAIAQRMDAGLIYAERAVDVDPLITAGQLHDQLADLGPDLVLDVLARREAGTLEGRPQDEALASRAPKLTRADGWVDLAAPARDVRCRVHGLTPWPGVTVTWHPASGPARPLRLLRVAERDLAHGRRPGTVLDDDCVATADGAVQLLEVQKPGGRPMSCADFARGNPLRPGDLLVGGRP